MEHFETLMDDFEIQLSLYSSVETTDLKVGFTLEEDFDAYFYCHSNKRNAINTLAFELDYERPFFNYEMCWIMEAINETSLLTLLYTNLYKMNFLQ